MPRSGLRSGRSSVVTLQLCRREDPPGYAKKRPPWREPLSTKLLSAKAEALDQRTVALDVGALQVTQEAATTTDEQQQAAAAVVVVLVLAGVLGEVLDALGQQRDLDLGRVLRRPAGGAALADAGLVDRYHLLVFPLLLGAGKQLFSRTDKDATKLVLVEHEVYNNGIQKQVLDVQR
mgnify:CR=1 FL=1